MMLLPSAVLAHFRAEVLRPALTVDDVTYSYATMGRAVAEAAAQVRAALGDGALRVGILAANSLTTYVGLLTALELDATYIPLDPASPTDRLQDVLRRSRPDVVLVDQRHVRQVEVMGDLIPVLEPLSHRWYGAVPRPVSATGSGHRYVLFTSGSTGVPKGIGVADSCIEAMFAAMRDIAPALASDVVAQSFELTFDLAQYSTLACWMAGAHLAVLSPSERLDPVNFVHQHQVSYWFSVPSVARSAVDSGRAAPGSLSSVRISLFCGEALPASLAHMWQRATAAPVWNLYGPTEATIACSAHLVGDIDNVSATDIVPLGRPFPGSRFGLLDAAGQVVDLVVGEGKIDAGELLIGGSQLFDGYLDDPLTTKRSFMVDQLGRRWYRTGDRVRMDDVGAIGYLGRLDEQIQLRGHRVEPREVEHRLARALGGARVVVVPLLRDDGTAFDLAVAVEGELDPAWVRKRMLTALTLPTVPGVVHQMDMFPLNSNGKIDRGRIQDEAMEAFVSGVGIHE